MVGTRRMKKNIAILMICGAFLAAAFAPSASASLLPAVGAASPATVAIGGSTLLTVTVTPADAPPSTGILVGCNLFEIGNSFLLFFDDGTHGDQKAGDLVFSFLATIPATVAPGLKTLQCAVSDDQGRIAAPRITLTVTPAV